MAIDPGFRTGCKVVALDSQGNLLHNTTVYPHPPQNRQAEAAETLKSLAAEYKAEAFAIGDGTAGRETEQLVRGLGLEGVEVNSPVEGLPYLLIFRFGDPQRNMLHFLAQRGIYVSSGSACAKGKQSHVLKSGRPAGQPNFLGDPGKPFPGKHRAGRGRPAEGADSVWLARPVSSGKPLCCRA